MKSKYGPKFNHDHDAPLYDEDVLHEENPVRTGYRALLTWTASRVSSGKTAIDLGCGTGNTIACFPAMETIYAVDISRKMLDVARKKLNSRRELIFIRKDLLHFCTSFHGTVDYIVSTYAIHHLLPSEKRTLFGLIHGLLAPGGEFICGDLMWKDSPDKQRMYDKYPDLLEDFEDEFYWNLETDGVALRSAGFSLESKQFSDLSWGIRARKLTPRQS